MKRIGRSDFPYKSVLAYLPLAVLAMLLVAAIQQFGSDTTSGPAQVALVVSGLVAAIVGSLFGKSWSDHEEGVVTLVRQTTPAIYIILMVGALIGVWMTTGTIPTIIYYGLYVVSPDYYYLAVLLGSGLVSLSIGSSWTAAGTVGLAFVSIAVASGLSPVITAGAVISGVYFGDKISPLSDTTNLAAASAGANLFAHVRALMKTSVPAFIISIGVFLFIGLGESVTTDTSGISEISASLKANYFVSVLNVVPFAAMIFMAARRFRPIPTLATGIGCSILVGIALTGDVRTMVFDTWQAAGAGHMANTGVDRLDSLLSRGGMAGMLSTIWLILAALFFGGTVEKSGCLKVIISHIVRGANSQGSLLRRAGLTALVSNIVTPDQYLSIVVPARMFNGPLSAEGIPNTELSRTLEDYGTVTSPLVPWNTCGAYMAGTLGIATFEYLPYCIFCLVSPALSAAFSFGRDGAKRIEARR